MQAMRRGCNKTVKNGGFFRKKPPETVKKRWNAGMRQSSGGRVKGAKSPLRVQLSSFSNFSSLKSWTGSGRKDIFEPLRRLFPEKAAGDSQKTMECRDATEQRGKSEGGKKPPSRSIKQLFKLLKFEKLDRQRAKRYFRTAAAAFSGKSRRRQSKKTMECRDATEQRGKSEGTPAFRRFSARHGGGFGTYPQKIKQLFSYLSTKNLI